jgi:thioredoxin reductase (NADPH)
LVFLHGILSSIRVCDGGGNVAERVIGGLFITIGADLCTGWLKDAVRLDDRGFILTGESCGGNPPTPYNAFQSSLPGVFAVGDVPSGSVKRVASAVGEGSAVHAWLASLQSTVRGPATLRRAALESRERTRCS